MNARLTLTLALLLICSGAALAQTPDWETPATETVCDDESGAAFGLCNAYCEAMDCESENPQASATACAKVQNKFMQLTGRDLPCEVPECPCSGHPEWEAVMAAEALLCVDEGTTLTLITSSSPPGIASATVDRSPTSGGGCLAGIAPIPTLVLDITPEQGAACIELLRPLCPPAG
ncbi:MAG TPA: hypothetical protein VFR31_16020 [Thermoanaerobaculia bacterium]|nr:hypothetical protein [Thermoanaerobaculia bacterium]